LGQLLSVLVQMTPARFDTYRRSLGLSVEETAGLCGVQDRTIRRWQSGASPIPDNAAEAMGDLEGAMTEAVEQAQALASDMTAQGPAVLWRYRTLNDQARSPHASPLPLGAHAMLIAWTADALEAAGIETQIEWAE
jgi:hypothetical protein